MFWKNVEDFFLIKTIDKKELGFSKLDIEVHTLQLQRKNKLQVSKEEALVEVIEPNKA